MGKKVTTEDFIARAKGIHEDKYDYSETEYINAKTKVKIWCKKHCNYFLQTPNSHLKGHGCPKCGAEKISKSQSWTKDRFMKALNQRVKNINYEVIGEFKGTDKSIEIRNKYGVCKVRANHLLGGVTPHIETAVDKTRYWVEMARETHGDKYDYSKSIYVANSKKLTIICKKHGEFAQTPSAHQKGQGCSICSANRAGKIKSKVFSKNFVDKANKIHKNKYDYKFSDIEKAKKHIDIICPKHGLFKQTPDNHLQGRGCPKCAHELTKKRLKEYPTGWKHSAWKKASERSDHFDSYKVYIIRCWNNKEEFYKVGRTFTTVEKRFKYRSDLPYEYEVLYKIENESAKYICELEEKLKNLNKKHKYLPKLKFGGRYECFSKIECEYLTTENLSE